MPAGLWTPGADAAKRDETPRKVLRRESGRARTGRTLEENEAHERMNPRSHDRGGRCRRKTISVRQKWRGNDGSRVTKQPRYVGTHKTLQGSQLHERQLRPGDEP